MELILTKIDFQSNVHNYNRYKANSHQLDETELNSIFGKPKNLFIIAEDFNNHNTLWSSEKIDARRNYRKKTRYILQRNNPQ